MWLVVHPPEYLQNTEIFLHGDGPWTVCDIVKIPCGCLRTGQKKLPKFGEDISAAWTQVSYLNGLKIIKLGSQSIYLQMRIVVAVYHYPFVNEILGQACKVLWKKAKFPTYIYKKSTPVYFGPSKTTLKLEQPFRHDSYSKRTISKGLNLWFFPFILRTGHCTDLAWFAQVWIKIWAFLRDG